MAETPRLPPQPGDELLISPEIKLWYGRLDINQTLTTVADMTPEAAKAAVEVARLTSAVPAEEKTKQAKEVTQQAATRAKHETLRYCVAGACVLAGIIGACAAPAAAPAIGVIVAVLSGGAVAPAIIDHLKRPPP